MEIEVFHNIMKHQQAVSYQIKPLEIKSHNQTNIFEWCDSKQSQTAIIYHTSKWNILNAWQQKYISRCCDKAPS